MSTRVTHEPAGGASPLVSVVIPAYEARDTVAQTVSTARAQTCSDIEIIQVDDGSRDDTAAMARAAAGDDPRFSLVRRPQGGSNAARMSGLDRARGDFVAFLDADDLWRPDKLAVQVAALQQKGDAYGAVYAWSWFVDETGRCLPGRYCAFGAEGRVLPAVIAANIFGNGSSALYRASHLRAVFPTVAADELYGLDEWRLGIALAERSQIALVPRVLTGWRQRAASKSRASMRLWRTQVDTLTALRTRHPHLPSWLFAHAASGFAFFLMRQELAARNRRAASFFARQAMLADPLLPLTLPWRYTLATARRRSEDMPHFLDAPDLETDFQPPPSGWLRRRRQRALQRLAGTGDPQAFTIDHSATWKRA